MTAADVAHASARSELAGHAFGHSNAPGEQLSGYSPEHHPAQAAIGLRRVVAEVVRRIVPPKGLERGARVRVQHPAAPAAHDVVTAGKPEEPIVSGAHYGGVVGEAAGASRPLLRYPVLGAEAGAGGAESTGLRYRNQARRKRHCHAPELVRRAFFERATGADC